MTIDRSSGAGASWSWCEPRSRPAPTSCSRDRRAPASPPCSGRSREARHTEFVLVEGNAELTPARLIGSFDPALVLEQGYRPENFSDGPLVRAMRDGGLLYVEELNRVPEETINVLLTVMSEGEINVPRLGRIAADESFRLVAAMNPYDSVGTSRLSMALYDRTCRISVGYQDAEHERQIVQLRPAGQARPGRRGGRAGPRHPGASRPALRAPRCGAPSTTPGWSPSWPRSVPSPPTTGRSGWTRR